MLYSLDQGEGFATFTHHPIQLPLILVRLCSVAWQNPELWPLEMKVDKRKKKKEAQQSNTSCMCAYLFQGENQKKIERKKRKRKRKVLLLGVALPSATHPLLPAKEFHFLLHSLLLQHSTPQIPCTALAAVLLLDERERTEEYITHSPHVFLPRGAKEEVEGRAVDGGRGRKEQELLRRIGIRRLNV